MNNFFGKSNMAVNPKWRPKTLKELFRHQRPQKARKISKNNVKTAEIFKSPSATVFSLTGHKHPCVLKHPALIGLSIPYCIPYKKPDFFPISCWAKAFLLELVILFPRGPSGKFLRSRFFFLISHLSKRTWSKLELPFVIKRNKQNIKILVPCIFQKIKMGAKCRHLESLEKLKRISVYFSKLTKYGKFQENRIHQVLCSLKTCISSLINFGTWCKQTLITSTGWICFNIEEGLHFLFET